MEEQVTLSKLTSETPKICAAQDTFHEPRNHDACARFVATFKVEMEKLDISEDNGKIPSLMNTFYSLALKILEQEEQKMDDLIPVIGARIVHVLHGSIKFQIEVDTLMALDAATQTIEKNYFTNACLETFSSSAFEKRHGVKIQAHTVFSGDQYLRARKQLLRSTDGLRSILKDFVVPSPDETTIGDKAVTRTWMEDLQLFVQQDDKKEPGPMTIPEKNAIKADDIVFITPEMNRDVLPHLGGSSKYSFSMDKNNRIELIQEEVPKYVSVNVIAMPSDLMDITANPKEERYWLRTSATIAEAIKEATGWRASNARDKLGKRLVYLTGPILRWWTGSRGDAIEVWR